MIRSRSSARAALARGPGILLLAFCLATSASAQTTLPPTLVLVLKVISSTHVRPVTGVVVSGDGLVLVPAEFVNRGDEIIVLDGGSDISRHGRPTRTVARSAELGLALLQAEGLSRPGILLAADEPKHDEPLQFAAYPAAEELAAGAAPLWQRVRQILDDTGPDVSPQTPLPGVNGVLLDACGYLAGLVLPGSEPGLVLRPRLSEALTALGVDLRARRCRSGGPGAAGVMPAGSASEDPGAGPQILDAASLQPAAPDLGLKGSETVASSLSAAAGDLAPEPEMSQAKLEPAALPPQASASGDSASALPGTELPDPRTGINGGVLSWWLPLLVMGAGLLGWWLGRRPRSVAAAQVLPGPGDVENASPAAPPIADAMERTASAQIILSLRVTYPAGREEQRSLQLPEAGATALLGRGQADFVLDDPSVARLHGRLRHAGGHLSYTDLGSDQGSWVDGIACLEGETFELQPGSELILGQVRVRLSGEGDADGAGA